MKDKFFDEIKITDSEIKNSVYVLIRYYDKEKYKDFTFHTSTFDLDQTIEHMKEWHNTCLSNGWHTYDRYRIFQCTEFKLIERKDLL